MKQPIIFSIDDDPQVARAIARDLRNYYRKDYRIISSTSAKEALEALEELKKQNNVVALIVSDQRMPEMEGVVFLEQARALYPDAKRVLLTAYSDTDAAIKAINDVRLDYYLLKPWNPPEEKLYPTLTDLLDDWQAQYVPDFDGIRVVGYQYSPKAHHIKDFLAGNLFPYEWLDAATSPKAQELLALHGVAAKDLPVVVFEDGSVLKTPQPTDLAQKLGLRPKPSAEMYDVAIIGAGPSGLAAAVYGASEGLKTLLIDRRAPGGQAGTSSRIENYLGFPTGLSGADLTRRAITQATRLGAEFLTPQSVTNIRVEHGYKILTLGDGSEVNARAVVLAMGVDYRTLDIKGVPNFTGAGVYYGAATTEAAVCKERDVYIVGGGNSAGQAAMYLSKFARNVYIVVRRESVVETMSAYLIDQIAGTPNITLVPTSEIVEALGDERLTSVMVQNLLTGETHKSEAAALFIFIGAKPSTEWLSDAIVRDAKGFVMTGRDVLMDKHGIAQWKHRRDPYLLETSIAGIFASGDVRSGAMNRVASAVGEGAMAISFVHKYLAEV